jgi:hypothetical protein
LNQLRRRIQMIRTSARLSSHAGFALIAAVLAFRVVPATAEAPDGLTAVTTPGSGKLTVCRNWLVTHSCSTYGKVALPRRIAIGDKIELTYGSNPKSYVFRVARLRQRDSHCTILSDASGANEDGEKIEVAHCAPAAAPVANGATRRGG